MKVEGSDFRAEQLRVLLLGPTIFQCHCAIVLDRKRYVRGSRSKPMVSVHCVLIRTSLMLSSHFARCTMVRMILVSALTATDLVLEIELCRGTVRLPRLDIQILATGSADLALSLVVCGSAAPTPV